MHLKYCICNTVFAKMYLQYYIFKTVYAIMHLQWCKAKLYCAELFCDEIPFPYCQCFVLSSHHWQWIKWQLILLMHSGDPTWPSQTSDRISCLSHLIELIEDVRMMETVSWWLMMMMMALPTLLPYERWKEAQPADISDRSKNFVCRIYLSLYSYLYLSLFLKAYLSLYSYLYLSLFSKIYLSLYIYIFVPIFKSISVPLFLFIFVPIFKSIFVPLFLFIFVPLFLFVFYPLFPSIFPPSIPIHICSSIHIHICPSISICICPSVPICVFPLFTFISVTHFQRSMFPNNPIYIYYSVPIYICPSFSMYICLTFHIFSFYFKNVFVPLSHFRRRKKHLLFHFFVDLSLSSESFWSMFNVHLHLFSLVK